MIKNFIFIEFQEKILFFSCRIRRAIDSDSEKNIANDEIDQTYRKICDAMETYTRIKSVLILISQIK